MTAKKNVPSELVALEKEVLNQNVDVRRLQFAAFEKVPQESDELRKELVPVCRQNREGM